MNLIDSFEKINVFSVNTNLGQVSMIANDMFFKKNLQCFNGKSAWFYFISVHYAVLKHFRVNLINRSRENQCFFTKH